MEREVWREEQQSDFIHVSVSGCFEGLGYLDLNLIFETVYHLFEFLNLNSCENIQKSRLPHISAKAWSWWNYL